MDDAESSSAVPEPHSRTVRAVKKPASIPNDDEKLLATKTNGAKTTITAAKSTGTESAATSICSGPSAGPSSFSKL